MGASFQLEFYSWEEIMIAKITLVSMLAAVALARPEADPQFYHHGYHHGVVGHVHPTCEQGIDTLEVQSCAPRVDKICNTVDVVSEEITYEKRCKEVGRLTSLSRFWAKTVLRVRRPRGVSTYPTSPITFIGGHSTTETEWTTSFLMVFLPSRRS